MKKIISFVLCIIILTCFSACSFTNSTSNSSTSTDSSTSSTENYGRYFDDECPIRVHAKYYTSDQTISITHTNESTKTIAAVKYLIVVYNVYGEELKQYGYGSSSVIATYDDFDTRPSSQNTGDWALKGFNDGKSVCIYVYSVYFTDGTEYGNRNLSTNTIKQFAPKTSVYGSR